MTIDAIVGQLQWVAMAVTVLAAWFVASSLRRRRQLGFWTYLVSNVLWVIWGISVHAWALVVLQFFLAGMNLRGLRRNGSESGTSSADPFHGTRTPIPGEAA